MKLLFIVFLLLNLKREIKFSHNWKRPLISLSAFLIEQKIFWQVINSEIPPLSLIVQFNLIDFFRSELVHGFLS